MIDFIEPVLEETPAYTSDLLREVFFEKRDVAPSHFYNRAQNAWFAEERERGVNRPAEEQFSIGMRRLATAGYSIMTTTDLFVPDTKGETTDWAIGRADIRRVMLYADVTSTLGNLAFTHNFRAKGVNSSDFTTEMGTLATQARAHMHALLINTQTLVHSQCAQVEESYRLGGECGVHELAYARAVQNVYDWQVSHGTFNPDLLHEELTKKFLEEVQQGERTAPSISTLRKETRSWLVNQIQESSLLNNLCAGVLNLPENIQFRDIHAYNKSTLLTYSDGVLLFLYRLTIEYKQQVRQVIQEGLNKR